MLLGISLGIIAAFLTQFLNYTIGKPGSEFSPYEIFSGYTVWLSIRRLQDVDLYRTYASQYNENIQRAKTKWEIIQMKNDFKKQLYEAAEPYFTWERAVGMCPVCTGFWITLIGSLFFVHNFFDISAIDAMASETGFPALLQFVQRRIGRWRRLSAGERIGKEFHRWRGELCFFECNHIV